MNSNFGFVKDVWPTVWQDCARAESYLTTDPRSACFYARRAVEVLVPHLYDVLALQPPYRADLSAMVNDAAFKQVTGHAIGTKLNLVRKVGNAAVHDPRPIAARVALDVLRELHHVVVWAAFHHSSVRDTVPTPSVFDPTLAAKAAPLTQDELVRLAAKFKAQDEAHAKALAERDELLQAHQAQIAALREQIRTAQASSAASDQHDYTEADTRRLFVDLLLHEAGWPLTDVRDREYPVTGLPNANGTGFVDYVLWGADGRPLAVVEAKRTTKSPQVGQQQAKLYADCMEKQYGRRPVVFYTNGYEHWLWDDAAGYPPREVQGFYTRDELELMIQRRQTRGDLAAAPVNTAVAGRPYQVRAIKAVGDAFDRKQREALLVMATGTGKTRTVIALVDQLMKAGWVKRVLFLADRTALVNQAVNAFKANLPAVTTVNLVTEKAAEGRVYASTYPSMMNLIDEVDGGVRRFGPGYFDLVVIDEAHRSVYAKYGAIFEYFDSLLVGLTATPKDEVDHNTYRLFHLEDGVPTDAYGLDEAIADQWLVPPVAISVGTKFLRAGITYAELSQEEKDEWDLLDWGDDGAPDEVGAEEINRFLFNEDTIEKVLSELMTRGHKVAGGDRLAKTIVFAKNQEHAEFVQQVFDVQYPEHAGHFARVITHASPYAQSLIDDFSRPEKAPHLAISVDMLDTGIDVPEVANLVFFKSVRSRTKFWQMLGRGTRLRPGLFGPGKDKSDFYVFDFCGNLEYFSQNLPGTEGSVQKSLTQRIVEARLGLLTGLDAASSYPELRAETAAALHAFVAGMNLDNFVVRPHRKHVERYADADAWSVLTKDQAQDVLNHLAGLPSSHAANDKDLDAKRFDLLMLRCQLATLEGDVAAADRLHGQVQAIADALRAQANIPVVAAHLELIESVAGEEWWIDVTLPMLELARQRLRSLVRLIEKIRRERVYSDFEDTLGEATVVELPQVTPGTNWDRFRAKAQAYLRDHIDDLVLQKLRRNKQLTEADLEALQAMLLASGAGQVSDIAWAAEKENGLGLFIRRLVGLERSAVEESFAHYLGSAEFSVNQVRFVRMIVDELTASGVMDPSRLFETPFVDHAPTGPTDLFPATDVRVIVEILGDVRRHAQAVPTVSSA
nr:DEAD/DEAH box helicase family protein [Cellulomonas uda]